MFAGPLFTRRRRSNGAVEWTFCALHLLHFCTLLINLHFDLEPDYIIRKPIKRRFQQCLIHTEIVSTFHTRVEYISWWTIRHSTHSDQWNWALTDTQTHKSENSISLADIIRGWKWLNAGITVIVTLPRCWTSAQLFVLVGMVWLTNNPTTTCVPKWAQSIQPFLCNSNVWKKDRLGQDLTCRRESWGVQPQLLSRPLSLSLVLHPRGVGGNPPQFLLYLQLSSSRGHLENFQQLDSAQDPLTGGYGAGCPLLYTAALGLSSLGLRPWLLTSPVHFLQFKPRMQGQSKYSDIIAACGKKEGNNS